MTRQRLYNESGWTYTEERYGSAHMRAYLEMRNEVLARVLSQLRGERRSTDILDVGFGTGLTLSHIARSSSDYRVFGIDFSLTMARQTQERLHAYTEARLSLADAGRLPFRDETFDAVYATRFIHQFKNKAHLMAEFARVTKPGGILAIEFYRRPYHVLRFLARGKNQPWSEYATHFPTRQEVRRIVSRPYAEIPIRLAGARLLHSLIGTKGLRFLTRTAKWAPLSLFVDEYFVVIRN